jgi:hypothetical protein
MTFEASRVQKERFVYRGFGEGGDLIFSTGAFSWTVGIVCAAGTASIVRQRGHLPFLPA